MLHSAGLVSEARLSAMSTASRPVAHPAGLARAGPALEKAMMKLRRYRVRGAIHRSGMEAMSVERYWVTPSMRLEGTNERATHQRRSIARAGRRGGVAAFAVGVASVAAAWAGRRRAA